MDGLLHRFPLRQGLQAGASGEHPGSTVSRELPYVSQTSRITETPAPPPQSLVIAMRTQLLVSLLVLLMSKRLASSLRTASSSSRRYENSSIFSTMTETFWALVIRKSNSSVYETTEKVT
ncbi:hypothetical protein EYF80_002821 [Liparis tanakae]|uniref:Uncharacterized protein n=1 Tax=Liparis tanakae TaxID=230148 RepID=A0A4Z2JA70_9TELE|nr:hypothetical protein EYF80_002821 [Liparis tanakae]